MTQQRRMQQMKEQDKNSQDQTNEEEIGSPPEKQFKIMKIKMIQNLRNTVEAQINQMEAQIEKIQEMFNKHLEDIRNRKSVMNKTTCEIKDT